MSDSFIDTIIRRSRLIMPANNKKFTEKAFLRNADAIVLDLEDSIPISEKIATRELIKDLIPVAGKGGSDVLVRVNNTEDLLKDDLVASIWPGLEAIYLPKVESAAQVVEVDKILSSLEQERGIERGKVKIGITIETVKGYIQAREIVQASNRIDSVTLGAEDFSVDSGIELSPFTYQGMLVPRMNLLFIARAFGKLPLGLMGSIAEFKNGNSFAENARLAYQHGFLGASCIHPSNVEILNTSFSPSVEEIEYSKKVIDTFETSVLEGKAATTLDGKMIDTPHYEKAKKILKRSEKIKEFELKKQRARDSVIRLEAK